VAPPETAAQAILGCERKKYCSPGEHFSLEQLNPEDDDVGRKARGRKIEKARSARSLESRS
jgi:hypothetical protein